MAKLEKILVGGLTVVTILVSVGVTETIGWRPFFGPRARPVTNRTFEITQARLERGAYLAEHVAGCVGCHSPLEMKEGELTSSQDRKFAGQVFPLAGLPGRIVASNITPDMETGVGKWTDDELSRAIREGISRDGHALFPLMPYQEFRYMPDEDLASVVVYIRSLPAVRNSLPATSVIFPVNYFIRAVPQPIHQPVKVDTSTPIKLGAYLVRMGGCFDCHTPTNKHGEPIVGMDFAGGRIFEGPWGKVASANITPDQTGISYYNRDLFIQTIRTGAVGGLRKLNPIMPYREMQGMSDADLTAIFTYLKTLQPVKHYVNNSDQPTLCVKCNQKHGLGLQNTASGNPASPEYRLSRK